MKRIIVSAYLIISALGLSAQTTVEQLRTDIGYLASDKLEGRETGTEGARLAGDYIAERFKTIGLLPKGSDGYFQPFSRKPEPDPHSTAPIDTSLIHARNVVGFIDNGSKTTVVIGAHYDHLGYGAHGSLYSGEPAIHNGADDNASGVAEMMETAKKLMNGPRSNNYLFIAFTGEEEGLWGSNFFTKEPTVDLKSINYMINMDMVGRLNEENTLALNGVGTSPLWKPTIDELDNGRFKFVLSEGGIGPSDQTSFYLKDIPVLHLFTGQHSDYHTPTDDVEKVNFQGMEKISAFLYSLIVKLDSKGRLEFTKTKDEDKKNVPNFSVTLGVVPDYLFDGSGMRISGVREDRPAAKAKLKEGDVVIKLGKIDVVDMMSYMKGLASFKKGDKTIVVVKRGEKELKRKIQF